MATEPELWSIQFSPWSLRVKWALRCLDFPFQPVEYILPLSEWNLRWKLMQWRVSVPVLFANDVVLKDGKDIVRYAQDRKAAGAEDLFVEGVEDWIVLVDEVMGMLRHKAFQKLLGDNQALQLAVPPHLRWLGPVGLMIVRSAINGMAAKYPSPYDETVVTSAFNRIRAAIESSTTDYILGEFSYADICAAILFQMVRPVPDEVLKMPRGMRASFVQEDVAHSCEDLLVWRDKIFAQKWIK
eukprot:jgi/Ulvmu1/8465/UM043_0045.1